MGQGDDVCLLQCQQKDWKEGWGLDLSETLLSHSLMVVPLHDVLLLCFLRHGGLVLSVSFLSGKETQEKLSFLTQPQKSCNVTFEHILNFEAVTISPRFQ